MSGVERGAMRGGTWPGSLPGQPRDEDGPVFSAPWEAQAFAITLKLFEAGHFTWPEWAGYLAAEIEAAQRRGDPDLGDTYYSHWLAALEKIAADKGLVRPPELLKRRAAWAEAYRRTPHGQPVEVSGGATGHKAR